MSINLNQIPFQSGLRSTPVNENFTDIQNAINDLQAQLDAMLTPPVGSEVTNARDYHSVLRDRLRSASKATGNVVITGGSVTQQASPNMTVAVAAGEAVVDGVACVWTAQNSGTITAPVSNPRYDVVVINSDNTLSVVAGSEAATPSMPSISSTQKALARLSLTVGMTQILTANILDIRKIKNLVTNNISTNTIDEHTDGSGVDIDGVNIKDGVLTGNVAGDLTGNVTLASGKTIKNKTGATIIDENGAVSAATSLSSADTLGVTGVSTFAGPVHTLKGIFPNDYYSSGGAIINQTNLFSSIGNALTTTSLSLCKGEFTDTASPLVRIIPKFCAKTSSTNIRIYCYAFSGSGVIGEVTLDVSSSGGNLTYGGKALYGFIDII